MITSEIIARIECLIPTYNILMLLLHSNLILKSSLIDGFSIRFNDDSKVAYFSLRYHVNYPAGATSERDRWKWTVLFIFHCSCLSRFV